VQAKGQGERKARSTSRKSGPPEGATTSAGGLNAVAIPGNYVNVAKCRSRSMVSNQEYCGGRRCGLKVETTAGKSRISAVIPTKRSVDVRDGALYSVAGSRSEGFDAHP